MAKYMTGDIINYNTMECKILFMDTTSGGKDFYRVISTCKIHGAYRTKLIWADELDANAELIEFGDIHEALNQRDRDVEEMELRLKQESESKPAIANIKDIQNFTVISKDADVDRRYGMEVFHITPSDIEALTKGNALYGKIMLDEYAIKIEYDTEEQI